MLDYQTLWQKFLSEQRMPEKAVFGGRKHDQIDHVPDSMLENEHF